MQRRAWFTRALGLVLGPVACGAVYSQPRSVTFSLERLQATVAERFPRRYSVQGLLDFLVQPPHLRLMPEINHLGARVSVQASGPLLERTAMGDADVDFGLRYEASDRTLRATNLRVNALRLDELPPRSAQLLRDYLADGVRQALHEIVVYRLREQDLMLADTLGLQPGAITVTHDGLRVELVLARP